jgi:hypothetical protein
MSLPFSIACATCIGQDGQVTVMAANGAVFVMLGALILVFGTILAVVISFIRRARRFAASNPQP